jgi:hypothetical protein
VDAPIRLSFALIALLLCGCAVTAPARETPRTYRETLVFRGAEDTTPDAVSFHDHAHRAESRSPARMNR